MKNYCTQNEGQCTTCSLVNYNRDCRNNPVDDFMDAVTHTEELNAVIKGAKEAIERIEQYKNVLLEDKQTLFKIAEALQKVSDTRHMAII